MFYCSYYRRVKIAGSSNGLAPPSNTSSVNANVSEETRTANEAAVNPPDLGKHGNSFKIMLWIAMFCYWNIKGCRHFCYDVVGIFIQFMPTCFTIFFY